MVGFTRESSEVGRVADQSKVKTPTHESGNYKFNFDQYSPELDELSFASCQTFLDFDSIKGWIEEMQDQEREEANGVEIEGGLLVEKTADNNLVDIVTDIKERGQEKSSSMKVELGDINENLVDNGHKIGQVDSIVKSDAKLANVEPVLICRGGNNGELKTLLGDEPGDRVLNDKDCPMVESLDCSIEEGFKKVILDAIARGANDTKFAHVGDDDDSDGSSESESESETSSSSSSSSSSSDSESDSDDEEIEKEKEDKKNKEKVQSSNFMIENFEQSGDVEEGELIVSDTEKMISWSVNDDNDKEENDEDIDDEPSEDFEVGDVDEDDDVVTVGPVKSKNELVDLPPVPPVHVTLGPRHQILPVGVILSILGPQVIVEGSEKHNPLSEGSILWITEKRLPLGLVDEIFGPVKTPYYIVRHNSEAEVPAGIQIGNSVGFVQEYVDHVLNDKSLYQKGYDASGENDEEVLGEVEFSDDEKESEYKRMMKMPKRGNNIDNNNQGSGGKRKNKRNAKGRDNKTWTKDQPSAHPVQSVLPSQQSNQNQMTTSAPLPSSSSQGSHSGLSSNLPILPGIPNGATAFPDKAQVPPVGMLLNGVWPNGMPFQHPNSGFPSGFRINSMPWIPQQNSLNSMQMPSMGPIQCQPQHVVSQFPLSNATPPQPQCNHTQLIHANSVVNFSSWMPNSSWPGMLGPHLAANQAPMVFSSPSTHLSTCQGMQPNGPQAGQNCNFRPAIHFPQNVGARPQFNQGSSSSGDRAPGRERIPFHQRGGGGGFRGGRGRQHFN